MFDQREVFEDLLMKGEISQMRKQSWRSKGLVTEDLDDDSNQLKPRRGYC